MAAIDVLNNDSGENEPTTSKVVDVKSLYEVYNTMLRRLVATVTYRYQIFILTEGELNVKGNIFKAVKKEFMNSRMKDDGTIARYWRAQGKQKYMKALNQRRQTLCHTLKGLVVGKKLLDSG